VEKRGQHLERRERFRLTRGRSAKEEKRKKVLLGGNVGKRSGRRGPSLPAWGGPNQVCKKGEKEVKNWAAFRKKKRDRQRGLSRLKHPWIQKKGKTPAEGGHTRQEKKGNQQ